MGNLAPIVLFVYNRPTHTQKTVEALLKNPQAKDSVLYIFADGLKPTATENARIQLQKVREYIHTIRGFKDIIIEESETNRGLANATIYGCTKVINKHDKIIMMEDDDIPSIYFLSYVNRCLNKFANDTRIWCVSGYTDTSLMPPQNKGDLFCVNRPSSWGFGTWKRCWDKVVWDTNQLKELFDSNRIRKSFNNWGGEDSSDLMLGLFEGRNSSWSIRYNFAAHQNKALTILPNKTLILNTGCDGSGTHCGVIDYALEEMDHEVVIPDYIPFDEERNEQLLDSFRPHGLREHIRLFLSHHSNIRAVLNWIARKK